MFSGYLLSPCIFFFFFCLPYPQQNTFMSETLLLTLWKLFAKFLIITFFWEKLLLGGGSLYTAGFGLFYFLGAWLWHQHFKIDMTLLVFLGQQCSKCLCKTLGLDSLVIVHKRVPVLGSLWLNKLPHLLVHSLASDQPENFLPYSICDSAHQEMCFWHLYSNM